MIDGTTNRAVLTRMLALLHLRRPQQRTLCKKAQARNATYLLVIIDDSVKRMTEIQKYILVVRRDKYLRVAVREHSSRLPRPRPHIRG